MEAVTQGAYLNELAEGEELEVQTRNRCYRLVKSGDGAMISGHPEFCPEPVHVKVDGSTWGGSMLKMDFIGVGMYLQFRLPHNRVVTTSRIVDVRPSHH